MTTLERDYSLLGESGRRAVATGLASAEWYHSDIPRKTMKELMRRTDSQAIRDTVIWLGLMIVFAFAAIVLWPSWWSAPFFLAYGVLYGSASDSRWHECGHGTAFRTRWMNDVVYQIACFMIVRNPAAWKWSHTRHHTDTYIVGRDPEIVLMRPPALFKAFLNFFGLPDFGRGMLDMLLNSFGILREEQKSYIPETEQHKVYRVARVWLLIYAATILLSISLGSILPLMFVGLPRLYGAWHHVMTGLLQHGGLAENVVDHRLNSRTVLMNPVSRFIYWNMNYHIEHHMFPMVPYHALPELHALIRDDLPAPTPSIAAGFREMWPAWKRQLQNEDHFILRELPQSAKPYKAELHVIEPLQMAG